MHFSTPRVFIVLYLGTWPRIWWEKSRDKRRWFCCWWKSGLVVARCLIFFSPLFVFTCSVLIYRLDFSCWHYFSSWGWTARRFSIGTSGARTVCVCVCVGSLLRGSDLRAKYFLLVKWSGLGRRRAVMSRTWLRCLSERQGGILYDRIHCFGSGGNAAVEGIGVCANWLRKGEMVEKKRWLKAASICLEPNCPCLPSQLMCSESGSWAFYPFTAL